MQEADETVTRKNKVKGAKDVTFQTLTSTCEDLKDKMGKMNKQMGNSEKYRVRNEKFA